MVFDPNHPIQGGEPVSLPIRENFLQLAIHHKGDTEPPAKVDGFVWWDTSTPTNQKLRAFYDSAWRNMFDHMESVPVPSSGTGVVSWQGFVKDKDLTDPPGAPSTGDRYIVASVATGVWIGHEDDIARWDGAQWVFDTPEGGWTTWVEDDTEIYVFNGASWEQESFGPHAPTHSKDGPDQINVENLGTSGAVGTVPVAQADGSLLMVAVGGAETVIKASDNMKTILEASAGNETFRLADGAHTLAGLVTITSKKNITIVGGKAAIVKRNLTDQLFKIEGCEDFTMEGFTILGEPNVATGNPMVQIAQAGAGSYQAPTRHRYANLHFDSVASGAGKMHALAIASTADFIDSEIVDCEFSGALNSGIDIPAGSGKVRVGSRVQGNILRTNIAGTTAPGIRALCTLGQGLVVTLNHVDGQWQYGIEVISTATDDAMVVTNNFIEGSSSNGIKVVGGTTSEHLDVSHNIVLNTGSDGININAKFSKVLGNTVKGAGGYGIIFSATSTFNVVEGNVFVDNANPGINNLGSDNKIDGKIEITEQTSTAAPTIADLIAIPDDSTVLFNMEVVAFRTNGSDQAAYRKTVLVHRRSAGSAQIQGTVQDVVPDIESDAAWNMALTVAGNNLVVTVTGAVGKTINWKARYTMEKVS